MLVRKSSEFLSRAAENGNFVTAYIVNFSGMLVAAPPELARRSIHTLVRCYPTLNAKNSTQYSLYYHLGMTHFQMRDISWKRVLSIY